MFPSCTESIDTLPFLRFLSVFWGRVDLLKKELGFAFGRRYGKATSSNASGDSTVTQSGSTKQKAQNTTLTRICIKKQKVDEGGKVSSIDDCENKKQGLNIQPGGDDKNCERLNGFL